MSEFDRKVCTKNAPMPKNAGGWWSHPDAVDVGEEFNGLSGGGDYDIYECPNCGLRFKVTVRRPVRIWCTWSTSRTPLGTARNSSIRRAIEALGRY